MISIHELLTSVDIGLIFGIVAIGVYLTFRTINFADLTCDGSFVLGASVSAILIVNGVNPYIASFIACLAGGLAGFLTGILSVRFKIADLLSGIIVAFMLYSVNLKIMNDSPNITFIDNETVFSGVNTSFAIFIIILSLTIALIFILFSNFGLKLRATGYNHRFAVISGINTNLMTIIGVSVSNALIAIGGSLFSQYQGFCDISLGFGTLVIGLTSVVIGEKLFAFKKEPLVILACVLGSIIYRIFINIALHSDVFEIKTQDLNLVTGIMIIVAMLMKRKKSNA
jgi:putative ABC transport system permease protein